MNAKLYSHLEIAFWDLVIYALSESRFVRTLIRVLYRFTPRKQFSRVASAVTLAAMVGLFSGLVLYFLAFHLS